MRALLILGAVVVVTVGLPALEYLVRALLRRPLSPEQAERDRLLEESRRDGRYFWR
jgi:hypothetical protein